MMADERMLRMAAEFQEIAKVYSHLTPPVIAMMQQTRAIEDLTQALLAIDNRRADVDTGIGADPARLKQAVAGVEPTLTSVGMPQFTGSDNTLRAKRKP
jgi:hypothetical protein